MTVEQINKAIAKACGWQHISTNYHSTGMFRKGSLIGTSPRSERTEHVPDYYQDLNEMHGVEETLTDEQADEYPIILAKVVGDDPHKPWFTAIHATAEQRAKAFLQLHGKYEEEKP